MTSQSHPTATPAAAAATLHKPAVGNFRLGEDTQLESDSESDQSAHSSSERRSPEPPSKTDARVTRSKKKRERKRVGALTEGLDTLLGEAFAGDDGGNEGGWCHVFWCGFVIVMGDGG